MNDHRLKEVIFVGLPGPTHNYGGLSADNIASNLNRGSSSNPKQAALQALGLVRLLKSLGVEAGLLPPQLRPHMPTLAAHFPGEGDELIRQAARENPALLEKMYSSSAMWTANAATVTPVLDSRDGKLHLSVANLHTNLHRRIEAADTYRVLSAMFANVPDALVHAPLDVQAGFRDEGAANHMRLAPHHAMQALNVYVYGADGGRDDPPTARQTLSAFEEITKQHGLDARFCMFVKQNPEVIREGVFHNDVIAVANESVLLVHERAYAQGRFDIEHIADRYHGLYGKPLTLLLIKDDELQLDEAVHTYFFNSQIISKSDGSMAIIAPTEVKTLYGGKAARLMESIRADDSNPIAEIHFADLRQSMNNGGGPACLRLRVPMTELQLTALKTHVNVMADEPLLEGVARIIEREYPSELAPGDIADPRLYHQCRKVLEGLQGLVKLPLL